MLRPSSLGAQAGSLSTSCSEPFLPSGVPRIRQGLEEREKLDQKTRLPMTRSLLSRGHEVNPPHFGLARDDRLIVLIARQLKQLSD